MTIPAKITDHYDRAQALLLSQFKGKIRIENFLAAIIDPTQITTALGFLTQAGTVTVNDALDATDYVVTINGFDFTYTATVPADTTTDIATALVALITAGDPQPVPVTATDNLDGTFELESEDGTNFTIAVTVTRMTFAEGTVAAVKALQELEDVFYDLLTLRSLADAIGDQLDIIGKILGQARHISWSDSVYRSVLYGIVWHNISNGQPEALIEVALAITESSTVLLQEVYPGYVKLTWDGTPALDDDLINTLTDETALGGVRVINIQTDDVKPFEFASGSVPEAETASSGGWGNLPEDSSGGLLSRLVGG